MRPVGIRSALRLVGFLLALAACGDDGGGGSSPSATGTVAYIVTSCHQTATGMTLQQEVRILQGEAEPVSVMSVGPLGPFPSIACYAVGVGRLWFYLKWGPLQRLGLTPDGSGVVFELTDEFVLHGSGLLPAEQRGIYYMRADGSGRHRLGPASRSPAVYGDFSWNEIGFTFDPSGGLFTYVDRGPDEAGHEAAQVFVQQLTPGAPSRQVTRLPAVDLPGQWPETAVPVFIDARTIEFFRTTQPPDGRFLLMDVDGTNLRDLNEVALPGGQVIPVFSIIGGGWTANKVLRPGEPVDGNADWPIVEVFVTDGTNVVQLTDFRRTDTALFWPFYSARDQRVYFTASADPFATNPTQNCQIFSIEPLRRDLRQLTFFRESAAHATNGCFSAQRPYGCRIDFSWAESKPSQDPRSGTILFRSTCDPFGQNPDGSQLFAMQPDGSNLRQLTNARGFVRSAGGIVDVETVDAFWNAPY